jgi:peptide/nickel transport system permease protein
MAKPEPGAANGKQRAALNRRPLARIRSFGGAVGAARPWPKAVLLTGLSVTAGFLVLAIVANFVSPYAFDQYRSAAGLRFPQYAPPSAAHILGTTVTSTDVLSRVIFGSRTAVEVVFLGILFSVTLGLPLGLFSGYIGGWLDRALLITSDALIALPPLILAIVIAFLLSNAISRGVLTAAIAISVVYTPVYYRVLRNHVISVREEPYVDAARALGANTGTVILRYVLQSVIQNVPVIATLNAADAILTLAGLGFLGYGIQPTQAAEWGYDIQRGIGDAGAGVWWTGLFPGLAIVLFVIGLTLLGEGLNEVMNPVIRRRRLGVVALPSALGEDT